MTKKKRVLVVEDESSLRMTLTKQYDSTTD